MFLSGRDQDKIRHLKEIRSFGLADRVDGEFSSILAFNTGISERRAPFPPDWLHPLVSLPCLALVVA